MGRGLAWMNGKAMGRHWNRVAECEPKVCPNGPFNGEDCPTGCGESSQAYYHVPADWITGHAGDEIELVVFDERGGDPYEIHIAALAG
jgi:hypothetical protein